MIKRVVMPNGQVGLTLEQELDEATQPGAVNNMVEEAQLFERLTTPLQVESLTTDMKYVWDRVDGVLLTNTMKDDERVVSMSVGRPVGSMPPVDPGSGFEQLRVTMKNQDDNVVQITLVNPLVVNQLLTMTQEGVLDEIVELTADNIKIELLNTI